MTKYFFLPFLKVILNHIPPIFWVLIDFIFDISTFWIRKLIQLYKQQDPVRVSKKKLETINNYNEWKSTILYIDKLSGNDVWRENFISKKYDYMLINDRIKQLQEARMNHDSQAIMSFFRSGLIRNFGGISNKELFIKSYAGTKNLIENYILECMECLSYLNDMESSYIMNTNQLKLDFFHDARQSFGSTALILQGGSLFGLCHLGVVKALYFKGLLPRIISGSAVGAAVASLVCTQTDKELIPILVNIVECMGDIDRLNNDIDERYGSVIENVITKGYSQDILIFMKFVRDTIGDLTFEEAYLRTEKILNIVVHPSKKSVPSLLNYVTSPNVIIWSAIYASIGTGILSDKVCLYVKDFNNQIIPKADENGVIYLTPQQANAKAASWESPYTRLTELFNVNHFVVSLARPYLAPLIVNDIKHNTQWKLKRMMRSLLGLELQHRLEQLNKFGLLTNLIRRFTIDEKTPRSSREIKIVPELRYMIKDFGKVFDVHRSFENIPYWILVGEKSVWPMFPLLWVRCSIEFALDDLYSIHRKRK